MMRQIKRIYDEVIGNYCLSNQSEVEGLYEQFKSDSNAFLYIDTLGQNIKLLNEEQVKELCVEFGERDLFLFMQKCCVEALKNIGVGLDEIIELMKAHSLCR